MSEENLQPVFAEKKADEAKAPTGPQRLFKALAEKYGLDEVEAAALRVFLPLDRDMITEEEFLRLRKQWLAASVEEM